MVSGPGAGPYVCGSMPVLSRSGTGKSTTTHGLQVRKAETMFHVLHCTNTNKPTAYVLLNPFGVE